MGDSSLGRVVGVLVAPEKTFHAIRESPRWVVALLVLVLLGTGSYYLVSQRMDMGQVVRESIEQSGREMTEEQIEQVIDLYDRFGSTFGLATTLFGAPLFYLLATLAIWVAVRLVGAELSFKQGWATFVHSQMPQAVGSVLSVPAILSREEFRFEDVQTGSILPSNLGFFATEEVSPAVLSLLSSIDVFSLWALVLLILGVATVGRVKRGPATVAVVFCWLLFVFGKAGWAALTG